jgi:hypothetical protein
MSRGIPVRETDTVQVKYQSDYRKTLFKRYAYVIPVPGAIFSPPAGMQWSSVMLTIIESNAAVAATRAIYVNFTTNDGGFIKYLLGSSTSGAKTYYMVAKGLDFSNMTYVAGEGTTFTGPFWTDVVPDGCSVGVTVNNQDVGDSVVLFITCIEEST